MKGYGFHLDSNYARVGRIYWNNSSLTPHTIPNTDTKFIIWGNLGWGDVVRFKVRILGVLTPQIISYFKGREERINSVLSHD
jgi:hypothetical protein